MLMVLSLIAIFVVFFTQAERISEVEVTEQGDTLITNCIKSIGLQYFLKALPLIVTSQPQTDWQTIHNLEGMLLEEFHNKLDWPLFISKPALSSVEKGWNFENYDKFHNYIMVLDYPDYNNTVYDFRLQMQQLRNYRAWYSRGIFIITIAVSVSPEEVDGLVRIVLNETWSSYIYNVIVLIPISGHNSTSEIEIYTWFPYQMPSGNCGVLQEVVLLDKCMRNNEKIEFIRNAPLFPDKVPTDLKGCPVLSITYMFQPYVMTKNMMQNESIVGGSEIKFMECIEKHMNISLDIKITQKKILWPGLREELGNCTVEIMFAALLMNPTDYQLFDGTSVYHSEQFTWTVPRAEMYPKWLGITRVFSPSNWALQFFTIAFVSVFINILFRIRYAKSGEMWNLSKSMLSMWAVYLGDGSPSEPKEMLVRIFFLTWLFQAFALNTVFQAFFTSYQIDPGRQHQIADFDELRSSKPTYFITEPLKVFFAPEVMKSLKPRPDCYPDNCVKYLATHKRTGMFIGREYIKYIKDEIVKSVHGHELYTFNDNLGELSFVFYTRKGFPLLPRMNAIVKRIFEAGLYNYWIDNIIETKRIEAGIVKLEVMDEFVRLSIEHLQGVFMFYVIGIVTSLLFFLGELGFYSIQKRKTKKQNKENLWK